MLSKNPLKKFVLLLINLTMIYICGTIAEQCRSGPVNVVGFYSNSNSGYLHYNKTRKLIHTDGNTENAFYSITIDEMGRSVIIDESTETILCFDERRKMHKNLKRVSPRALHACIIDTVSKNGYTIQMGYNIMQTDDPRHILQLRSNGKKAGWYMPKLINRCTRRADNNKIAHGKCKFDPYFLKQYLEVESCIDEQINACRILKKNKFPIKFGFCDEYENY